MYFIQSLHEPTDWELYNSEEEFKDSLDSHRLEVKEAGGKLDDELITMEFNCNDMSQFRDFLRKAIV